MSLSILELVGGELDSTGTTLEGRGGSVLLEKNSRLIARESNLLGIKHIGVDLQCTWAQTLFSTAQTVYFLATNLGRQQWLKKFFRDHWRNRCWRIISEELSFSGNLAWNEQGGAIGVKFYRGEFGSQPRDNLGIVLENCTFHKNSARTGGAVFFAHASTAIIRSCIFDNNIASSGDGGSLFIDNGVSHGSLFCIERTVFENNSALQGNGGSCDDTSIRIIVSFHIYAGKFQV